MVIGAPKCGTTSLFDYLRGHPQVRTPARKELCFFSKFKRHLQPHRLQPSTSWELYTQAFAGARRISAYRDIRPRRRHGAVGRGRGAAPRWRRVAGTSMRRRLLSGDAPENCTTARQLSFEACPFYLGERAAAVEIRAVFPSLRLIALLRNPRERTVSAFNDYIRMGRIRGRHASDAGMEQILDTKLTLLRNGSRTLEDFDMRILTSGVYIHGLEAWGRAWPADQLLVMRSEAFFADTDSAMGRVHSFLGITGRPGRVWAPVNRNTMRRKSRPSRWLNETLDAFFAPYNERLYEWAQHRGLLFGRWANASSSA